MRKPIIASVFLILSFLFFSPASAQDLTISTDTTWQPGTYTYDNVTITNSATLTLNGSVTLNAQNLIIDSGSSISSDGKGHLGGQGPGKGNDSYYGSGAGYGGKGGLSYAAGGATYGSSLCNAPH